MNEAEAVGAGQDREVGRDLESGFSLVEVAIGMAVLVTGMMGLGMAMLVSFRLDRTTTERKIALSFAASQIERIRGMSYADITLPPRTTVDAAGYGGYAPPTSWGSAAVGSAPPGTPPFTTGMVGYAQDVDSDTDLDVYARHFYRETPGTGGTWSAYNVTVSGGFYVPVSDSRLNALTPRPGFGNRLATVTVRDTDSNTGESDGKGYWVTVRVFWWSGSGGDVEEKVSTFIPW